MKKVNSKYSLILLLLFPLQIFGKEVLLIRHAKVKLDTKGWMLSKKAEFLRESYDTATICQFDAEVVLIQIPLITTDTIYTSTLPRSMYSAVLLFDTTKQYVSTPLFDEVPLRIVRLPLILSYSAWRGISRIVWLTGLKRGGAEDVKDVRIRAKLAADFIENKIVNNGQVVMVTHGFINRKVSRELKRRGWQIVLNDGKYNLGATVLMK